MPVLGSHVEWAHALGIPRVHFDPARVPTPALELNFAEGEAQRRRYVPLLKEVADDFGEPVLAGDEEGRGAVLRYAVGVGTLLQQVVDGLLLVVITGYIQRRDICVLYIRIVCVVCVVCEESCVLLISTAFTLAPFLTSRSSIEILP
jgi:hypothetical protein